IGDHNSFAELVDDAHRGKRAGADAHPVRIFTAVTDHVESHIAARRLDTRVAFTERRTKFLWHLRDRRSLRHHLETLAKNFHAFLHLADAHPEAIVAVAQRADFSRAHRHFEF